jgi:hypothetical protein
MRNYIIKSFLALACLALMAVPLPVNAQSSQVGLSIATSASTVARGGGVAVFGLVTNNTSTRMRVTVSLSSFSPCGVETSLGGGRLSLEPGRSIAVSSYYPVAADACTGVYAVTISAESEKGSNKNSTAAAAPSATAYLEVQ